MAKETLLGSILAKSEFTIPELAKKLRMRDTRPIGAKIRTMPCVKKKGLVIPLTRGRTITFTVKPKSKSVCGECMRYPKNSNPNTEVCPKWYSQNEYGIFEDLTF